MRTILYSRRMCSNDSFRRLSKLWQGECQHGLGLNTRTTLQIKFAAPQQQPRRTSPVRLLTRIGNNSSGSMPLTNTEKKSAHSTAPLESWENQSRFLSREFSPMYSFLISRLLTSVTTLVS